jgi:hypothetical protein
MYEDVFAFFSLDETVAFSGIEPFNDTLFFCHDLELLIPK